MPPWYSWVSFPQHEHHAFSFIKTFRGRSSCGSIATLKSVMGCLLDAIASALQNLLEAFEADRQHCSRALEIQDQVPGLSSDEARRIARRTSPASRRT